MMVPVLGVIRVRGGPGPECARPARVPRQGPFPAGATAPGRVRHAGATIPVEADPMWPVGGPKAPPAPRAHRPTATGAPPNAVPTTPSATALPLPVTGALAARNRATTRTAGTGHRLERLAQHTPSPRPHHLDTARTT